MTLNPRGTDDALWGLPDNDETYQDPLITETETVPSPEHRDAGEEVPLFQDEPTDGFGQRTHTCFTYPSVKLALVVLATLALFVALPCTMLAVDKQKAMQRMQAPGAIQVKGVSVDVSQAVPVVGLNVTIQKSAFPKLTTVHPQSIECVALNADWGRVWVATVQELLDQDTDTLRQFYINATMNLPEGKADDALQAFANVAWQLVTQQSTYVGPYKCHTHVHAKIAGIIQWQSTEQRHGVIDLIDVWRVHTPATRKPKNIDSVTSTSTASLPPFPPSEDYDGSSSASSRAPADPAPSNEQDILFLPWYDSSTNSTVTSSHHQQDDTTQQPFRTPLENDQYDTPTENAPVVPGTQQQQQPLSYIEVHQVSADRVVFGFHLHISQSILDAIPDIRVHLPMLALVAQLSGATQSIQLSMEELDLTFSTENDHNYGLAEVSCGHGQFENKNNNKCAWYSPLVQVLQDTVNQKQDNRILNLYVQANNSFLQRMVGPHHAIEVYHQKMTYQWYSPHNQPRRRQLQDSLELNCVLARSALFGDIFDFRSCMNLKLSKGLALDGYINFYGYGGSWKGDLEWQRAGNTLWLEGAGKLDLELADEEEDTMMDLQGSAMLDLENLKGALYANNTAKWLPFRSILEGSVEYLTTEDILVVRVDNATFDFDSQQYMHATGEFRLDNINEDISAVLMDPRLEMTMEGSLGDDDNVIATWRVLYDGEDVMTGESDFAFLGDGITVELQSAGKLKTGLRGAAFVTAEEQGFEVTQALLEWDGAEKMNVEASAVLFYEESYVKDDYYSYNETLFKGFKFAFEDSTSAHEITFGFEVKDSKDQQVSSDFQLICDATVVISGKKKFTSGVQLDIYSNQFAVEISGSAGGKDYFTTIDGEWFTTDELLFEYKGNSVLSLDDELLWSEYVEFSLSVPGSSIYSGTLKLLSSDDSAEVQFFVDDLSCEWDGEDETFTCTLSEMTLTVGEEAITDSSGDMLLDLPARMMSLDLVDDFKTDKQGYIMSISGNYANNVLSGKIQDLTVVSDGDNVVDARAEMKIDIADASISFDFEDVISETLMAVDRAGLTMERDDGYYDDNDGGDRLEITLEARNMRMVMKGEPWVKGGMEMGLDWTEFTIWMILENNTTKLPMDLDFSISVVDDTLTMSVSAVSSPPPSLPTPEVTASPTAAPASNTSETSAAVVNQEQEVDPVSVAVEAIITIFNTKNLTAEFLSNPENAEILAKAFEAFVVTLIASMETNEQQRRMLAPHRRLELSLLSGSAIVSGVQDVDCPTGSAQSIPAGASCQTISGAYEVAVTDEDPVVLSQKFAQGTERAIEAGKLQQSILAADPEFPVTVFEAVVQGTVVRIESPKNNSTATTTPPVVADATTAPNITVIPDNAKTLPVVAEATTAPAITVIPDTDTAAPSSGRSGPGIVLSLLLCFASCLMW